MNDHQIEVERGERFAFGSNWAKFLQVLNPQRIALAEESLREMLEVPDLRGLSFIDIGSGSGLFSLAARRLGARVHSFDYDAESVQCTLELRNRYFPGDDQWTIERGSVLDNAYLARLGQFDVVYSWGVLHHTGAMWEALANVAPLVAPGGKLFIAIYNDQGSQSRRWRSLKRTYNKLHAALRPLFGGMVMGARELRTLALNTLAGKPWRYIDYVRNYAERGVRGMSYWHDLIDWMGGYPFEVAKSEEIFRFFRERGFALFRLTTCGGELGCNEFVFVKD